ncbi:uridine kinase [Amycolatopsis sp. BJA-103]|uniref:uridine kinase n=1 Tax=Amycolatopsis sp. BJA-103 TaxID=1911175 RepID=UPI000C78681D|nr:uridine kinase [Amycolatopsis sp. BJA-103]AUI60604.1 uridine kinase [Amycolatopsis sp. BJA-103]PNE16631.1 uridine kinase [Amycolatopsis sp. BJA-103]
MRYRPISPALLVSELTDRITTITGRRRIAVAVDGAAGATNTTELADALVDPLRIAGHAALRISANDFLRPASLRFERGKEDPDSRYSDWLDLGALRREVLDPLAEGGSGRVLPSLWDPVRDRATRAERVELPEGGVVLVEGEFLFGAGLAFDLSVHLWLSPSALKRRVPDEWALPAYERYEQEVDPTALSDVVIRVDDPNHPARYEP